uniref:Carbohydrate deacetylase n=1 Tax=Clytia hemisphaerica TaxID=252671 RepID=A0A7M5V7R6_9CNID
KNKTKMALAVEENFEPKQFSLGTIITIKVTADDYGYCPQRNEGILEALNDGIVNSVSVLVNAAFVDPIPLKCCLKTAVKKLKLGLHLNLTEGRPVTSFDSVETLLDHDNEFFPKALFQEHLKLFSKTQIYQEIKNQIVLFNEIFGKNPDYIDGHQHCHIFPIITEELVKCMDEFDIQETRIPHEIVDLVDLKRNGCITENQEYFFQTVLENCITAKSIFDKREIRYPHYFIGLSTMSKSMTESSMRQAINIIKDNLRKNQPFEWTNKGDMFVELMAHPGFPCVTKDAGCSVKGPDDFAKSHDRLYELNFLKSQTAFKLLY